MPNALHNDCRFYHEQTICILLILSILEFHLKYLLFKRSRQTRQPGKLYINPAVLFHDKIGFAFRDTNYRNLTSSMLFDLDTGKIEIVKALPSPLRYCIVQ